MPEDKKQDEQQEDERKEPSPVEKRIMEGKKTFRRPGTEKRG